MSFTIWRRGVLLGRTDLAMPSPGPRFRVGQLEPTAEFERAWPEFGSVVGEVIAAGATVVGDVVADLPPTAVGADATARGRQVYDLVSAHRGAARLRAAGEALAALGLELRDPAERTVTVQSIMVQEVRPPASVPAADTAREVEQARAEGRDVRIPSYVVIVLGGTEAPDVGSASRPPA